MCIVASTVFFDGQFWIALIERTDGDGTRYLGRYTFGPEPSNPVLLDFYLRKYVDVLFFPSDETPRFAKARVKGTERERKSLDAFKDLQREYLSEKKAARRVEDRERSEARFRERREKRKKKKRGH